MKKFLALAIALVMALSITACGYIPDKITEKEAQEHYKEYISRISDTADAYSLSFTEFSDEVQITLSDYESVIIYYTYDDYSGVESFDLEYTISDETKNFNTQLLSELVEDMSSEKVSKDFFEKFINAPESEYSAQDYGLTKSDDVSVYKFHPVNFWEDWTVMYTEHKTGEKVLSYGGFAKLK